MNDGTSPGLDVEQLKLLHAHLFPGRVKAHPHSGYSYLQAWDIRAMLVRVFGYGGFSVECLSIEHIRSEQVAQSGGGDRQNWSITVQAIVRLTIHATGAVYTEAAVANAKVPDFGEAYDQAVKSAESDALKRGATNLGTQFGLSLYNDGSTADVVKRVAAPGQKEVVDLIREAEDPGDMGQAARERLQLSVKVHEDVDDPIPAVPVVPPALLTARVEPVQDAFVSEPDPGKLEAARAALVAAETQSASHVKNAAKARLNEMFTQVFAMSSQGASDDAIADMMVQIDEFAAANGLEKAR